MSTPAKSSALKPSYKDMAEADASMFRIQSMKCSDVEWLVVRREDVKHAAAEYWRMRELLPITSESHES